MPIRHTEAGWFWGSKGPFKSRKKAEEVAQAAYAHGYKGEHINERAARGLAERRRKKRKR